jgi:hypothetical protein
MKFISLLIALVIIGVLVKTQLNSNSSNAVPEDLRGNEDVSVPKVPTAPKDVPKFEQDINEFIDNSADKRAKEMDESLNN